MPAPPTPATDANLLEIFSSIQGEGPWLGRRQIFIRFAGCNRACAYCDTPVDAQNFCRLETVPGHGVFEKIPNPVSLSVIKTMLGQWLESLPGAHHSLSLTGGEPLLSWRILCHWLPELRSLLPIYLETNGTLPQAMEKLLPWIDYVATDIKLPSMTKEAAMWEEHGEFLRLAGNREGCVKIVIDRRADGEEIRRAARLGAARAPRFPLILQPRTGGEPFSAAELLDLQGKLAADHPDVRVIPQMHPVMGLL
ncbi:MAG: 7-carboxy-7-deazaguanine synthase QueE [Deltaproteobacteria bacterium]|nr:7-carboxy-7-deazaguanine synthase QueE [Deltaproteobacteria bacterium]